MPYTQKVFLWAFIICSVFNMLVLAATFQTLY